VPRRGTSTRREPTSAGRIGRTAGSCRHGRKVSSWARGLLRFLKVMGVFAAAAAGVGAAALLANGAPMPRSSVSVSPSFSLQGSVSRVVDGDTLIVAVGRKSERVRLIGIDAPELGSCFSAEASTRARRLSLDRSVRLLGDRTQARRDRYGRLLAYVRLPNGHDLGRDLIAGGFATVYIYNRPFTQLAAYRTSELAARSKRSGLWATCPGSPASTSPQTTTNTENATTRSANCHQSYPTVCIAPAPPDLDCRDVPHAHFKVLWTVPDPDPHHFDGDHDGIGCETST
jgi:micrococcal nuclease